MSRLLESFVNTWKRENKVDGIEINVCVGGNWINLKSLFDETHLLNSVIFHQVLCLSEFSYSGANVMTTIKTISSSGYCMLVWRPLELLERYNSTILFYWRGLRQNSSITMLIEHKTRSEKYFYVEIKDTWRYPKLFFCIRVHHCQSLTLFIYVNILLMPLNNAF